MFLVVKRSLQILLYLLIVCGGIWGTCTTSSRVSPTPSEVPHLLTVAHLTKREPVVHTSQVERMTAQPFHHLAAIVTTFLGTPQEHRFSLHTYRLFPTILFVLTLLLIPALGLRRRGGIFETDDAPFWAALFLFLSPMMFHFGGTFTPLSFHVCLFFLLLFSTRTYVQWPNYPSAIFIGILIAMAGLMEPHLLSAIPFLIPIICIGIGWRTLTLYWHNGHLLTLFATALGCIGIGWALWGFQMPVHPMTWQTPSAFLSALQWRITWLCAGGFSLLAWGILLIWNGFHPERRWERIFLILFPILFILSFFFEDGGGFAVPLLCLSVLLIVFLLSTLRHASLRYGLGFLTLLTLCFINFKLMPSKTAPTNAQSPRTTDRPSESLYDFTTPSFLQEFRP